MERLVKLVNLLRGKLHEKPLSRQFGVFEEYEKSKPLYLGFGTGRCAMRWMNKIFIFHDNCNGGCERLRDFESFIRFVDWNKLPIDLSGIYKMLQNSIQTDWKTAGISFLSSPYFSFSINSLVDRLRPDVLFHNLRQPEKVINSMYLKGWYGGEHFWDNKDMAPGLQPYTIDFIHRALGHILPKAEEWEEWLSWTQIGRIAWFYQTTNNAIYNAFREIQGVEKWTIKLEDFDQNYEYYLLLAETFGLKPVLTPEVFYSLKGKMKNRGVKRRSVDDWSRREKNDFETVMARFPDVYSLVKTTGF